jgi:tetratricopeptide (TPR) repeat protein
LGGAVGGAVGSAIANRPNLDLGNRQVQNNFSNINANQWNQYNQLANVNRPWYSGRPGYWNQPWYGNRPAWNWSRPWYNYHYGWHSGYWNDWPTMPGFWLGTGLAAASALSPGDTFVYSNPYYAAPADTTIVVQPELDYSAAIPAPTVAQSVNAYPPPPDQQVLDSGEPLPTTDPPPPDTKDETVAKANKEFDAAREAFKAGDPVKAQALVDKAIVLLPSDATLHEFRALTLFAQGRYKDAAATLYAVLAAGPGWDWKTMRGLYPDEDSYTRQLRALEEHVRKDPNSAEARFVLAYQYLVLGSKDEAVKQLKEVVRLQPQDKLSSALLKALTPSDTAAAPPAPPKGN